MTRCYGLACGILICMFSLALVSGCRAFNSTYSSPEADLIANPPPKKPDPAVSKPKPTTPAPAVGALVIDYSKDTTECKTPEGVTVGKNPTALLGNSGWALPLDGEQVTVTATKRGLYSAAVTIQKDLPNKSSSVLSFVVKQTASDKFSACNFSYAEGKDRVYQGVTGNLMIDRVNAADEKAEKVTVVNSGSFELTFTRAPAAPSATKVQSIYLGAAMPGGDGLAGILLDGAYLVDVLSDSASK